MLKNGIYLEVNLFTGNFEPLILVYLNEIKMYALSHKN